MILDNKWAESGLHYAKNGDDRITVRGMSAKTRRVDES